MSASTRPAPTMTCPRCDGPVRRVSHTVGEQPVVLPCGHLVSYRFERGGAVSLRTADGRGRRPFVNPVLPR